MNILFTLLIVASMSLLLIDSPEMVYSAMLNGATRGIEMMLTMTAIYTICMSILDIMTKAHMDKGIERMSRPIIGRLFQHEDEKTRALISTNFAMNLLGMGGAATPIGIRAIERMQEGKCKVTQNSTLFAVINATSIQLIPTTIIGMRAAHGADSPSSIILPSLISTTIATIVGIVLVKVCVRD